MTGDIYEQAASEITAALRQETPEVQQAYRYLFARVALDAGILQLIGREIRESGQRLVCREPNSGAFYAVERPTGWSAEAEEQYVAEMRRQLIGEDGGAE
jgi:hypothetical protein